LEKGPVTSGYVKIAIENGSFIVDFPIKNGDFPWLCGLCQNSYPLVNIQKAMEKSTIL